MNYNKEELEKRNRQLELFIYGLQKMLETSVSDEEVIEACKLIVDAASTRDYYKELLGEDEDVAQ